jgi:hypothetical protein
MSSNMDSDTKPKKMSASTLMKSYSGFGMKS